jgi:uncharacterized protein with NRDE domain
MCLLVVAFRVAPEVPLLIGANRDEFLDRPAVPMTILQSAGPRILGGQDRRAGGTWLAVNEHGLFAGLTNQPLGESRDPTRRSRGELPLALASHADAGRAVDAFVGAYDPADYNGSWILVGDRESLFYIDFTGRVDVTAVALSPGVHVLENRPLGAPSPKAERVRASLGTLTGGEGDVTTLRGLLADHFIAGTDVVEGEPRSTSNCVHLDGYGTRSSCILRATENPTETLQVWVAGGPPCTSPFADVSSLWTVEPPQPQPLPPTVPSAAPR